MRKRVPTTSSLHLLKCHDGVWALQHDYALLLWQSRHRDRQEKMREEIRVRRRLT